MSAPTTYLDSRSVWERQTWVTQQELAAFSRIPTARVALSIALTWLGLLVSIGTALWSHSLAVAAIACFANGILFVFLSYWSHEAAHFLVARDRRRNDLVADLFLSGPIGMTVAQHRWQHQRHHAHLNDPAYELDLTAWIRVDGPQLAWQIFLHAIGWYAFITVFRYRPPQADQSDMPPRSLVSKVSFVLVNGGVFALCALQGQWYLYFVLWVFPLFTLTVGLLNLFNLVEHQATSEAGRNGMVRMPPITRVIRAGLLERWLIAPFGVVHHFEHHRFPGVPSLRLAELHDLLEQRGRFREDDIVRAEGYLRTLWRLSRDRSYGVRYAEGTIPSPETLPS